MPDKSIWLVLAKKEDPTVQPCEDCGGAGKDCATCHEYGC